MPIMDKTGPLGTGPTGRGRGGCCQKKGRGFGRGICGNQGRVFAKENASRDEEVARLERQLSIVESRLNALESRES
jgi:hypothetical protein